MKIEELEVGKEYFLDTRNVEKGIYIGSREKDTGFYFKPTTPTEYIIVEEEDDDVFAGCVGFLTVSLSSPVK